MSGGSHRREFQRIQGKVGGDGIADVGAVGVEAALGGSVWDAVRLRSCGDLHRRIEPTRFRRWDGKRSLR